MRLQEAIKKAHELKCRIKNAKLKIKVYQQRPRSLIHWLFVDTETELDVYNLFDEYMTSTTWEMDFSK